MATFIYFIIKMGDFIMKKALLAGLIVASLVASGCGGVKLAISIPWRNTIKFKQV